MVGRGCIGEHRLVSGEPEPEGEESCDTCNNWPLHKAVPMPAGPHQGSGGILLTARVGGISLD